MCVCVCVCDEGVWDFCQMLFCIHGDDHVVVVLCPIGELYVLHLTFLS